MFGDLPITLPNAVVFFLQPSKSAAQKVRNKESKEKWQSENPRSTIYFQNLEKGLQAFQLQSIECPRDGRRGDTFPTQTNPPTSLKASAHQTPKRRNFLKYFSRLAAAAQTQLLSKPSLSQLQWGEMKLASNCTKNETSENPQRRVVEAKQYLQGGCKLTLGNIRC